MSRINGGENTSRQADTGVYGSAFFLFLVNED
jgi:hypothetical protein